MRKHKKKKKIFQGRNIFYYNKSAILPHCLQKPIILKNHIIQIQFDCTSIILLEALQCLKMTHSYKSNVHKVIKCLIKTNSYKIEIYKSL